MSGEDASGWREAAAKKGIDVPTFETEADHERRRLYAEVMAPRVAQQMLDAMGPWESE